MSATAAQEPDSQENWHRRLADCFQVFGTAGERLLPAKSKVSFRLPTEFHAVPVEVGYVSIADGPAFTVVYLESSRQPFPVC